MDKQLLKNIVEGALMAANQPLTVNKLSALFELDDEPPANDELKAVLKELEEDCKDRGYELVKVASGWRYQTRQELANWVNRLWEEKPARYSRAAMETLALIAYKQPITRGDIENVRGVAVSSNIIKTLMEREWIRVVGHRDVPGRPALYATTKQFLDYFNLKNLEQLPPLSEIKDLGKVNEELSFEEAPSETSLPEGEEVEVSEVSADESAQASDAEAGDPDMDNIDGNDEAESSMATLILPGG